MESRIQLLFVSLLSVLATMASMPSQGATDPSELELEPLVVREPDRREIDIDKLDEENFEIGAFGGIMSIEDFGSDTTYGARIAYHISEDFFVEGIYGQTTLGQTSFEQLSGGAQLLSDDQRDFTYYNVSIGYNILPGEAFIGKRWAFKGGLYLIGGIGSSNFGGDELFTYNAGLGYRFAMTDWLAIRVDVRDHVFESDLLGTKETKHNIEFTGGLTVFF